MPVYYVTKLLSHVSHQVVGIMVSHLVLTSALGDAQVTLNGARVPVKTFQDYVNLYLGAGTPRVYEKLGERWEICVSLAEQGQFQQVHTSLSLMVLH